MKNNPKRLLLYPSREFLICICCRDAGGGGMFGVVGNLTYGKTSPLLT